VARGRFGSILRHRWFAMLTSDKSGNEDAGPDSGAGRGKRVADRFIDSIEMIAAAFVGIVALNTFAAVVMRKLFAVTIPDYYDFGRLLLGILIFWGIAAASYRGSHITVDLLWANVPPRYQRGIDVFATLTLLFVVTVQTITLFDKVRTTYRDNVLTYDLGLPNWPFFAVAWIGDVSAVALIAVRSYRLIFHPEDIHDAKLKTAE
jgi:TRAP-type C4-dicarboxylate transport system permease small subunit